jgi:hypothetical protein
MAVEHLQLSESKPDKAYKWVIRSLYLAAISLNVWYLTQIMKETEEGAAMLERAKTKGRSLFTVWHGRTFFKAHAESTVQEAEQIVKKGN